MLLPISGRTYVQDTGFTRRSNPYNTVSRVSSLSVTKTLVWNGIGAFRLLEGGSTRCSFLTNGGRFGAYKVFGVQGLGNSGYSLFVSHGHRIPEVVSLVSGEIKVSH